jgi:hypothetical protein
LSIYEFIYISMIINQYSDFQVYLKRLYYMWYIWHYIYIKENISYITIIYYLNLKSGKDVNCLNSLGCVRKQLYTRQHVSTFLLNMRWNQIFLQVAAILLLVFNTPPFVVLWLCLICISNWMNIFISRQETIVICHHIQDSRLSQSPFQMTSLYFARFRLPACKSSEADLWQV